MIVPVSTWAICFCSTDDEVRDRLLFIQRVASPWRREVRLAFIFEQSVSRHHLKLAEVILVSCKLGPIGSFFPENSDCGDSVYIRFHQVAILLEMPFAIIRDKYLGRIILVCFVITILWIRKN